ncbi:MAG TPA: serine hydrolase domain-containing protein, partial [Polyangia bacterium]
NRARIPAVVFALFLGALPARAADPLPRARPDSVGLSSERLGRIKQVLEKDVERGRMPGAVVAIARRGKLVYFEAFGYLDKSAGVRMPKDAIFSLASMTKPMTGVATLLLQEEGLLHLAEPASKYLPALGKMRVGVASTGAEPDGTPNPQPKTVPLRVPISIQDLMCHTAGMAYGFSGKSPLNKLWPNTAGDFARRLDGKAFVDSIAALPLIHQPGSVWEYSVSNDVLGVLVEAVAGQPLGKFLEARVFAPLGMRDTGFVVPPDKVKRYARALPNDPETGTPQIVMDGTTAPRFDCGGACAVSTAADYVRFAQMLLERGRLGSVRVLGRKSVELMTSDHLGTDIRNTATESDPTRRGVGYGLTVSVRTEPGVSPFLGSRGEFGWGGAYGTQFWVDPQEQLVVVFMAHTPGSQRAHYRRLIGSLVLQAIVD